jgi:MscS family membrane protein|tara:strand:- start:238 stop:1866 length:1629 start_codon:yes stop_codon:yes gene_type:complete
MNRLYLRALMFAVAATLLVALVAIVGAGYVTGAKAQDLSALTGDTAEETPAPEPDLYDRDTPRGLVTGFVAALGAKDYERAAVYLEGVTLEETGEAAGNEARRLQIALDQGGTLIPFAGLSNDPAGDPVDSLPLDREKIGDLKIGGDTVPLLAQRVETEDGNIWQISAETLAALPALPKEEAESIDEPDEGWMFAGAPLRDWLVLIFFALAAYGVIQLVFAAFLFVLRWVIAAHEESRTYKFLDAALAPLALYLAVIVFFTFAGQLETGIVARQTLTRYAGIVGWVAFVWFAWRIINAVSDLFVRRMQRTGRARARSAIVFARRSAKILLGVVVVIAILDTVGVDVTTGIAALGIGGLALALGAQKTIENLVGSLTVIIDQPIRVGDFCEIGGTKGVVIDIGMRSTRIRTNERTMVTIPNGQFADEKIENYALRDRFLFHQTIGVSYDTNAETMERVLQALREILRVSETVIDEDARVRFHGFGASSLDIEIFTYFRTNDYPESLAMQEELLFAIMRKLAEMDVDIAFPTQTVHVRGLKKTG